MSDWHHTTRLDYERKGFAGRSGYGRSPLLLVVDFIVGFTDPSSPLGSDFARELQATVRLQEQCRRAALPIVYTTIAYAPDLHDGGLFVKKVPSLAVLIRGSPLTEVDARLRPVAGERTIEKQYASAFFGTDLDIILREWGVDTVIISGTTTENCCHATARIAPGGRTGGGRENPGGRPDPALLSRGRGTKRSRSTTRTTSNCWKRSASIWRITTTI